MEKRVPKVVKRRRLIKRLIESADSRGAVGHYMTLLMRMTVGYDPSQEYGSPRRG